MKIQKFYLYCLILTVLHSLSANASQQMMGPNTLWQTPLDCGEMAVWDAIVGMCMPLAMEGMPMRMFMLHGNTFGTRIWTTGLRGKSDFASTSMVMADLGTSISDRHYLNLELMATAEKWLFPDAGYPLLLQIGEHNPQGNPFIDAQHPHSSPIMGLTLSDTIRLTNEKDYLKLSFAPRGEATDGPIAFMHRYTGFINPDAPLGHHVGQDVGHISSTVLGMSLRVTNTQFEVSTYHGAEPEPERVDLPLGSPDSLSFRIIEYFSPDWIGMVSAARVNAPEPDQPDILFENRYSASIYTFKSLGNDWFFHNSLLYGLATQYDYADYLSSFAEEFLFRGETPRIWGRIEVLQRTGDELAIPVHEPNRGLWVAAFTLGYTHKFASWEGMEFGMGGSFTQDWLPPDFRGAYGGNPWSAKVFAQLGGMHMWGM